MVWVRLGYGMNSLERFAIAAGKSAPATTARGWLAEFCAHRASNGSSNSETLQREGDVAASIRRTVKEGRQAGRLSKTGLDETVAAEGISSAANAEKETRKMQRVEGRCRRSHQSDRPLLTVAWQ